MCAEQSKVVSIKAKIRIYKIVIRSTVTANCETLTMTNDICQGYKKLMKIKNFALGLLRFLYMYKLLNLSQ